MGAQGRECVSGIGARQLSTRQAVGIFFGWFLFLWFKKRKYHILSLSLSLSLSLFFSLSLCIWICITEIIFKSDSSINVWTNGWR